MVACPRFSEKRRPLNFLVFKGTLHLRFTSQEILILRQSEIVSIADSLQNRQDSYTSQILNFWGSRTHTPLPVTYRSRFWRSRVNLYCALYHAKLQFDRYILSAQRGKKTTNLTKLCHLKYPLHFTGHCQI